MLWGYLQGSDLLIHSRIYRTETTFCNWITVFILREEGSNEYMAQIVHGKITIESERPNTRWETSQ